MKVTRHDSSDKNVCKYVFDFDDAVAEAVLYRYPTYEERTVICCSAQSGCPMGCKFCGTGAQFVRNLTEQEIVDQIRYILNERGIDGGGVKKFQIMFMSMGEPMLNFRALRRAIIALNLFYPNADLLISTAAPEVNYGDLVELSVEIPKVGLQFSIHESLDSARNALIPFKHKLDLTRIAAIGNYWATETGRQAFFNYCAHEGNTTDADADRLRELFDPQYWQATVSVICEKSETISAAHERQREQTNTFMAKLLERGYSVRAFDPAGQDDIGGGCGQLWATQRWMKDHPEYVMERKF